MTTSNDEFSALSEEERRTLSEYLIRLGDDRLILGHRLSEWCGHGPALEEDLALANIALDLLGQASAMLSLAGKLEGRGRDEDRLAYFRETTEFKGLLLCELPKGDFAFTIARQFLFDCYGVLLMEELQKSTFLPLAAIAAKSLGEQRYHLRHTEEWVIRLGDGTEESHCRISAAFEELQRFSGEAFITDSTEEFLHAKFNVPLSRKLQERYFQKVNEVLQEATLGALPSDAVFLAGGREGKHTEYLGKLLAEMQILPRSYPDARW